MRRFFLPLAPILIASLMVTPAFAALPTLQNQTPFSLEAASPKIDGGTGAFTEHVPIDIPPGRNGLQPDLSLDYNSQNTDNDNIVGYGWTVSIPYIERLNKTGSQDLYGTGAYFTSSIDGELATNGSTTVVTSTTTVWVLAVGGGGGGGCGGEASGGWYGGGGGGGAGGVVENSALSLTASTSYSVTIGSGGAGASCSGYTNSNGYATNGASSTFGTLITAIGGGGAGNVSGPGQNGGSGGGAGGWNNSSSGGTGTSGQGHNGGKPTITNGNYGGGGGGGWGAVGPNSSGTNGADGGAGAASAITGSSTFYAGGGSGGGSISAGGSGGSGGGGSDGANGTNGLGGGGGGADGGFGGHFNTGGTGGSGVVIIRYPTVQASSYTCGGSVTTTGTSTICTFTSSGSFSTAAAAIVPVTNSYSPRIYSGDTHTYIYDASSTSWTMYDKKGNRYLFGSDSNGQQSATTSPNGVFKWMLEEVRDTNGNYVKYTYLKDGNQIYPSQIIYTGNGVVDGPMTITFSTTTRTDAHSSYTSGFKVWTNYLISQITAAVNGVNVRQYTLSYTTGNNGVRALLSGIQEAGWSDTASTTLPSMTFAYMSSTTSMLSTGIAQGGGPEWIVGDVTGHGRNETTVFWKDQQFGNLHGEIWPTGTQPGQGGNTFSPPVGYWALSGASPCCDGYQSEEDGVRFVDVNADGKLDVVQGISNPSAGTSTQVVDLNTSSSSYAWSTNSFSGLVPGFVMANSSGIQSGSGGVFSDVNGTGLPSYVQREDGYFATSTYLANGSAWNAATTTIFAMPYTFPVPGSNPSQINLQLIDVNGDHLDDIVYSDDTKTYVQLNTGSGWEATPDPQWTLGTSTVFKSPSPGTTYYDRGMRFADINGDGLVDILHSYQMPSFTTNSYPTPELTSYDEVYLNTGHGWATSTVYALDYITKGDVTSNTFNGRFYLHNYNNYQGNGQQYQDVLTTIHNTKGGTIQIQYGYTTQSQKNPILPYNLLTATSIASSDGRGGTATTTYVYAGGQQYLPANVFDRKFAGFASTTETHADKTIITYYSQGATTTSIGDQADGYPQLNHVFRTDILSPSGALIEKTFYRWDPYAHGFATFVGLGRKVDQLYASDGTHRDTAVDYLYASATDDLAQQTEYGEVIGNSDGTFSTSTSLGPLKTTKITYTPSNSRNLSLPIEKLILDTSNATSTDTKYFYDSQSFGSVTLGNLTQEQDWATSTHYASSTKTYDSYGLVASSTDADGNSTTFSFDGFHMYPATSTDALNHSTAFSYNYSNGDVSQTKDPNGSITKKLYDGVGRVVEIDQSDVSSPSSLLTKSTFAFSDSTTTPSLIHESDYLSSATTTDSYRYYDGLNRLVQERKSTENSGTYSVVDENYDSAGNLLSKSYPYFGSGSSNTASSTTASLYSFYTYDALGRILTTANSVGTTSNVYAKWNTTVTDPNGHIKDYGIDAYKNLVNVVEHGNSLATTTYAYDLAGDLTKITDASGNVRNFTYDGLGRELTSQDLHTATSSSFGNWSFSYDDVGNSISQTDPRGATTTRTYDAVNRMLAESSGGLSQLTNTYDSCPNGIGRLCTASTTAAKTQNSYDALGRLGTATTTISGTDYVTISAYDRQGNITDIVYPDGSEVAYTYSPVGKISKVRQKIAGGSWGDILSASTYSPVGQLSYLRFGNGASTTNTYDGTALYRLVSKVTALPNATQIQNSSYTYDSVGNILSRSDSDSSGSEILNYTYDNLNRLLTAFASSTRITTTVLTSTTTPVQLLIVGGGGGGGAASTPGSNRPGGGGGGGGVVYKNAFSLQTGAYNVTIGAGGSSGVSGGNSSFGSITAIGGGAGATPGGSSTGVSGGNGGSGGGGAASNAAGGTATSGEGSNGGGTDNVDPSGGGGGGGATAVGSGGNNSTGGNGGTGTSTAITGSSVTYGGGGGGGAQGTPSGNGGSGGGGKGGGYQFGSDSGASGTANTGGGGGGGGYWQNLGSGGSGGSGIVVISAPSGAITSASGGTHTTASGNDIWTFTSSGTFTVSSINGTATTSTVTSTSTNQYGFAYDYDALGNILSAISGLPSIVSSSGERAPGLTTSDSFAFNAGETSSSTILLIAFEGSGGVPASATFNGQALTLHSWSGQAGYDAIGYLTNPASGTHTFNISYSNQSYPKYRVFVLNNVDQSNPFDAYGEASSTSAANCSLGLTTSRPGDLIFGTTLASSSAHPITEGSGQVELWQTQPYTGNSWWAGSTKIAHNTGSQTLNYGYNSSGACDVAAAALNAFSATSSARYSYGASGNANPDAVTSINYGGVSTTTFSYDANGNLISAAAGATTTAYTYDYLNRLSSVSVNGSATTTYGYDYSGSRVSQATGNSTTFYPNKYYSVTSATNGTTTNATTTEYIYTPDSDSILLATNDQPTINGTATGTPVIRYVHVDNLGSTQSTTDGSGNLAQKFEYAPYGSVISSSNTGTTTINRQYIGQMYDQGSGLSYLNARYYNSSQGQFLSQDPIFLGDPKSQILTDPQSLNSYSYSDDNPITKSDPNGKQLAALAGSYGTGYLLGSESGPFDIFVGTAIGTTLFLASQNSQRFIPTAPGFQRVYQESIGQGYNPDPEFNGKNPPPGWGTLGKILFYTGTASYGGCVFLGCDLDYGTQVSTQPAVSGTSQLPPPTGNSSGPIQWNNISYAKAPAQTYTNYSQTSSQSSQGGSGYSTLTASYIAVLQQTVSVLKSIVGSYGATPASGK